MEPRTIPPTPRTMRRSVRLFAVLLTSTFLVACASSETGDDTGTGGSSATGGSGTGGQTETGGTTGSGGVTGTGGQHSTGGNTGSGGTGTGGVLGTGGNGTGGNGTGGNGTGGNGTGTGGMAGAKGTGGMAGAKGTGGIAGATGGGSGTYNPCPTNGDPCKVLPLGDSITFGINYEGSYRVELFKKAVTASQNITFVGTQTNGPAMAPGTTVPFPMHHEGWSGYTIAQIQGKAAGDVTYAPHMILVHAGTNDTYGTDPSGAPARLSTLVDYLTTTFPSALVVVAKIIPYPAQTANVKLINDSIPSMVQSKVAAGKHVVSVDLNTGFQTSTMLSSDGIHPNQTGYNWMGDTWYAVASSYFP
jgi:hypothetical protein